jgi:thioredoxin 1
MTFSVPVNNDNFQSLVDGIALLQFWSPKCGPCKLVTPAVEDLAEQYLGELWVGRVKMEDNPEIVSLCKVDKIPTFSFVHKTVELERLSGAVNWSALQNFIERNLQACN